MARRYQRGSLQLVALKDGTEIWEGRFREEVILPDGRVRRPQRRIQVGTIHQFRTKSLAWRAFQPHVDRANAAFVPAEIATSGLQQPINQKAMVPFKVLAEKWLNEVLPNKGNGKYSNRETAKSHLNKWLYPAFGSTPLGDIRSEGVHAFFQSMKGKAGNKTARNVKNTLAGILRNAKDWEYITHNPLAGVTLPRYKPARKQAYSLEHCAAILANVSKRYFVVVFFLAETGLRSGEMIIEIPDVDLVERKITIRQAIWHGEIDTPKTDSGTRSFHISERLTKMLIEYIGDRKTGPVFASRTGTPIDIHNFCSRGLAAARRAANVGYGDIHTFRHFNATLMDSLKVPGAVKRLRLGHAGVTVTEGYEDVIEKDDQAAAEQIAIMIWTHLEPKLCPSCAPIGHNLPKGHSKGL